MIRINIPANHINERIYVIDVLLKQIIGLEYEVRVDEKIFEYEFILPNNKKIYISDFFFSNRKEYLNKRFIPKNIKLLYHDLLGKENLVVLFGENNVTETKNGFKIHTDLVAGSFFMLTRWEELINDERDDHDRFPAKASTAFLYSFLDRPIVDEYSDFLWKCIKSLCPGIARKKKEGLIIPTCDVDYPFDPTLLNFKTISKALAGDLLKRTSLRSFTNRILKYHYHQNDNYSKDPYYSFNWYMDVCEQANRKAEFYFISGHTGGAIDGCYNLTDKIIVDLMQDIKQRGHNIGMHGSYNTFQNINSLKKERNHFNRVNRSRGIQEKVVMNRQHFLRWDVAQTPDYLEQVGFKYDSTGGYADVSGFRYGTAHSFTMWSWKDRKALNLIQKPLIMMEVSVIGKGYQNLGYSSEAMEFMLTLKKRSLKFGGNFIFLWHNSHFNTESDKPFFKRLISN